MLPPRFLKPKSNPCIVQSIFNLCSQGRLSQAVDSLDLLASKGLRLDSQTLGFLLQQCSNSRSLREGKLVHLHLNLTGRKKPNTLLSNHLIKFYCECGQHVEARSVFDKMSARSLYSWNTMLSGYTKSGMIIPARRLFDKMPERDVVSWNTMVAAYAQSGCCYEALMFYLDFRRLGIGFSEYSFAGVFMVCVKLKELGLTRQVHGQVLVSGYFWNVVLSSSAVDAYAKCGEMSDARKMFDEMGMMDVLAWTTLVSGYAMWGDMQAASELFNAMPEKNPVSWTALISGYARHGMGNKALDVFSKMILSQIRPDQFTFSSCLCACASIASLKLGKQIHAYLIRTGFRPNTIVVSSLIDMYSKCGSLGDGRHVFDIAANKQNCVLWNTMLSALAQHGYGEAATKMYDDMVRSGVKPDRITFVVILNACSHSGLTEEGLACFRSMTCDHGIVPDQEHYACLTDLLGRAGRFDELMNQLEKMPCKAGSLVWNALLGVCRIHGNLELGRKAAEKLIELEPQSSAAYVFLSSIYSALGSWESVEKLRHLMNKRHMKKERAISWVETGNKHHAFTVSDRSHPSNEEICSIMELLAGQMEVDA